MKILNINSYYYSSSVHKQLQKSLLDRGIDTVTYVPLAKGYVPRDECKYEYEDYIEYSECYNSIDRYIFHLKHSKILSDIRKKFEFQEFDLVHAHSLFSNGYIALQLKKKYNISYIVAVRDTDVNTFFRYMVHLRNLGVQILQEAEKIIFLSKAYRSLLVNNYIPEQLRDKIMEKVEIIPNGIDSFWLNNKGETKLPSQLGDVRLVYAGVVNKRKNLTTTIKAIDILQKSGYKVLFDVVGRIEDETIYNQIKDLSFVKYIKPQSKEKLRDIYIDNDIFVMPSITETFGLTYAEAMSQGLPVIYSKGQGFDGQFKEGEIGYSVNCFDANEIAEKLLSILSSYEEKSKNCIVQSEKFNWDLVTKDYIHIYNNL